MQKRLEHFLPIFLISTIILAFGSLPTWAGYQAETSELSFRGLYFDTQDYAVHISMMEAGRNGETAYQFRFTTEQHKPAYLRLFYIALGHIGKILSLSNETTFDLARWFFGYAALFSLYKLTQRIFKDPFWVWISFVLAVMGSGIGWLQLILNWTPGPITPIDFWLIDCYVFFSLSLFPHFAFVTAGMCIIVNVWLEYLTSHRWRSVSLIAVIAFLVQLVNPIALATVDAGLTGATLASWWKTKKVRRDEVLALIILALAQMPMLGYNLAILNNDPIWRQFTTQNKTLSPPVEYYLLGFALFLPFAFIGIINFSKNKSEASAISIFWIISGFILAYSPVLIQRRFLQNITIPFAILAVQGMIRLFETRAAQSPFVQRWQKGVVVLFVLAASFSSIQLSLGRILYTQSHPPELYYPANLDDAIDWLRENGQYNDFVLAAEETSQIIAQKTGMRVYLGHEMETLGYENKQLKIQSYFDDLSFIAPPEIKWIVYGPYEQMINKSFQPGADLEPVYDEQGIKIFKVQ